MDSFLSSVLAEYRGKPTTPKKRRQGKSFIFQDSIISPSALYDTMSPDSRELLEDKRILKESLDKLILPVDKESSENDDETSDSLSLREQIQKRIDPLLIVENLVDENEALQPQVDEFFERELNTVLRIGLEEMPAKFKQTKLMHRYILFLIILAPSPNVSFLNKKQINQLLKTDKYVQRLSDFGSENYGANYTRWSTLMNKISMATSSRRPRNLQILQIR